MNDLAKFEYIHWVLSELLDENQSILNDEINKAITLLEQLRENEFNRKGANHE